MNQKTTYTHFDEKILSLMKNAGFNTLTPLQKKVFPVFFQKKDIIAGTKSAAGKRSSYIVPIIVSLGEHSTNTRSLIIVSDPETSGKACSELSRYTKSSLLNLTFAELVSDSMIKKELKAISECPDIVIGTPSRIIDHIRRENINLSFIETVVIDTHLNLEETGFNQDLVFIFSKMPERHQNIFYTDNIDSVSLIEPMTKNPVIIDMGEDHLQENSLMKSKEEMVNYAEVENSIKSFIKTIVENEDPDQLNIYKKLFKKYTPLSKRGYLSAYLLKEACEGSMPKRSYQKKQIDPDKTTLFISIGKNRRVFPKDLARLFQSRLDLEPSDIGAIKVLESYSFMDISKEHAERAIELLNEEEFKGRKLTVNHARKRNGF